MRLIDADELLKEVIGIHDGWLQPPKRWQFIEDSIKNAPTITLNELLKEKYERSAKLNDNRALRVRHKKICKRI